MRALEAAATVSTDRTLVLDRPLPQGTPHRVRDLVLYDNQADDDDLAEAEWLEAAARSPAFAFLKDAEEDVYTLEDGTPLTDAR